MAMLNVNNLSFKYNKTPVLKGISFEAKQGENIAIIGESGSGKSTLLKLLYGEYDLDEGTIFWKDQEILGPKYNLVIGYDFMKYVAQEFDLMPYISVEENIAKHLSRFFPEETQQRVSELIEVVELEDFAKTKVKTLSGGQKQRVALARALAKQPQILLLDEPFSHIDNFRTQSLRRKVFGYLKAHDITCIVATHSKEDVLGFADRMIVLDAHKIIAQDTPKNLYQTPKLPLIASFFEEFNVIDDEIYYAHQLKISFQKTSPKVNSTKTKKPIKSVVTASYFNGASWLIEVKYNSKSLVVKHPEEIDTGTVVFITFC